MYTAIWLSVVVIAPCTIVTLYILKKWVPFARPLRVTLKQPLQGIA